MGVGVTGSFQNVMVVFGSIDLLNHGSAGFHAKNSHPKGNFRVIVFLFTPISSSHFGRWQFFCLFFTVYGATVSSFTGNDALRFHGTAYLIQMEG